MRVVPPWVWMAVVGISGLLLVGSIQKWAPLRPTEVLGFISGAVCVLFVVDQNIWNFPVGIANNVFFIILFLSSRLYGDMALQIVYIFLGIIGWRQWIYGGANRTELHVCRASMKELLIIGCVSAAATAGLRVYFVRIHDSAPLLDALTTVLSLIAQYLLNGKRIENWFVWIIADAIYVGLYLQKGLFLTAVLYAVFIGMCIAGLLSWRKEGRRISEEAISL
jgi:nicotinamide mononucleotide transporter